MVRSTLLSAVLLALAIGSAHAKPSQAKAALAKVMYGQKLGSGGASLDSAPMGSPLGVSKRQPGSEIFKRQSCQSGYWQCLDGLCYPRTYGCCQSSYGHGCPPGKGCCGDGCWNENGACCNWDRYYGCDPGWTCCEGKCIPEGTSCCKGGKYCEKSKPYCVLYRGEIGCCTTSNCSEEFEETEVEYSWYYTTVYWTYYWYYYYYSVRTTYTTSTRTTTSTVVSVYATNSQVANSELSATARELATETPVQTTTTFSGSTPEPTRPTTTTSSRGPRPTDDDEDGGDDDDFPSEAETLVPTSAIGTGGLDDLFPSPTGDGGLFPTEGGDNGGNGGDNGGASGAGRGVEGVLTVVVMAAVGTVMGMLLL